MKTIRILSIIGMLAFPAASIANDLCVTISDTAETIMEKRQENIPIRTVLERLEPMDTPALKELVKVMVLEAYKKPLMRLEKNKKSYTIEFGNEWYLKCVKGMKE